MSRSQLLIMRFNFRFLCVLWIGTLALPPVSRCQAQNRPVQLRVATREIAPFVMRKNGQLSGFSIDLWNAIAEQIGVTSKFEMQPSVAAFIESVRTRRSDVGATSITSRREEIADFSQPIYDSGLQILVRGENSTPSLLEGLFQVLHSPLISQFVVAMLLLMLVPAHLVWLLERRYDDTIVRHKNYFPGIFESAWWTVSCLATQSEEMPKTVAARIVAVIWMFFAIIFTAYVTAALTANLTLQTLRGDIQGPDDLPGKRVATVAGSTSENYLRDAKITPLTFPTVDGALQALQNKSVEAVVYDAPILKYFAATRGQGQVSLVGSVFRHESYGFVLPNGSPWRKKVNFALLSLRENGTYDALNTKWFGTEQG